MSRIRSSVLVLCVLCGTTPLSAQSPPANITAYVDSLSSAGAFSGVVLVAKSGQPVVELARGFANRRSKVANGLDTQFQLASGDKWFTKIAISQLAAAGKLTLDDTVGKFLPDYPSAIIRSQATIAHLLTHRSGLGSYWNDAFQAQREKLRTLKDVVALFDNEEPAFTPGERMQYSNSGYVLLGRIIEVASGMSYYDYVQRNVFLPANMSRTAYVPLTELREDIAIGYTNDGENTSTLPFRGSSAGGGYSTARDLLRLDNALRQGMVGDTSVLSRVTMRGPGGRVVLANGGGPGANVEISRIGDYTVIVLANLDPPAASNMLQRIRAML
jgi:D-alanyl-D-alanine carboxypeptidase